MILHHVRIHRRLEHLCLEMKSGTWLKLERIRVYMSHRNSYRLLEKRSIGSRPTPPIMKANLLASSPACLPVPRILSTSGDKQRIRLLDLGYNAPFLLGRIGTITIIINFCNPPPFRNRRSGFMCQMDTDEGFEPKNYFSNNHHD